LRPPAVQLARARRDDRRREPAQQPPRAPALPTLQRARARVRSLVDRDPGAGRGAAPLDHRPVDPPRGAAMMAEAIQRVAGPQPTGERNGEFSWTIPLSGMPSRAWLKFFKDRKSTRLNSSHVAISYAD